LPACSSVEPLTAPGRSITRFSTLPSSPTSTTSARACPSGTNETCASRSSRRGTMTTPAAAERSDKAELAAASAASIVPPSASPRSICARSAAEGSAACMIPSTKSLRPTSVGMRPALVCGAASSPASCNSCKTERIEAGERLSVPLPAMVREPTGWPLAI
jgi:hypothetical protein